LWDIRYWVAAINPELCRLALVCSAYIQVSSIFAAE
jgi:hypothetical protein